MNDPAFEEQAFKKFKKSGTEEYCLVDYTQKLVECDYKSMHDCREQYGKGRPMIICFPRKSLKLDEDKKK